ncbi:gamma-glutamylcyclotransferase [Arvimicrobium flavum]|uniref:gamma-glutamylcyclotransferase n=1 Tax=Arvimicrobium flavum TaxID=3393320 RepID=UPI00237AFBBC|nr:gamma-glutamylcyclotransferase [Mesorhizobium shangrilense]
MGDFWVFGYGSLMWRPGFAHVEVQRARLHGFRRSLCVRSWVHRGTQEHPGLVLGLDRGGSCIGLAFRVPIELREEVLAYLRERELVTRVYLERTLPIKLSSGGTATAVCYVVDRGHEQYAGRMDAGHAAEIVATSHGQSGPNDEYVINTLEHLNALEIRDHWLEDVGRRIRPEQG